MNNPRRGQANGKSASMPQSAPKGKGRKGSDSEGSEDVDMDDFDDDEEEEDEEESNPARKPASPTKPKASSSKLKPVSKGKRKRNDSDDEEEEEEDDEPPPKKARKPASSKRKVKSEDEDEDAPPKKKAKPASRVKAKVKKAASSDEEEDESPKKKKAWPPIRSRTKKKPNSDDEEDEDSEPVPKKKKAKPVAQGKGKKKASSDEDEEEDDEDSEPPKKKKTAKAASRSKGKKKASSDEEDSEPSPRKKAKPVARRKQASSDEEEDEDSEPPKKKKAVKPVSRGKGKKKASSDEEDEDSEPPKKKVVKPVSRAKGKKKASSDEEEQEDEPPKKKKAAKAKKNGSSDEEDDDDVDNAQPSGSTSKTSDEMEEIDGHKPKVLLADGEERDVKSLTSDSVYKIKRTWDHYYCRCPAWCNQGGAPVNARTCKHLRDLLGEKYEAARLKWKNPSGPALKPVSKKGKSKAKPKSKSKRAKGDDDEEDEEDDDTGGKQVPALLLANKWDIEKGQDPTGWWISEKLDGVRTFYDGKGMVSRLGNPFTPPQWFLDKLPKDVTLDGELFGGRGKFQDTVSIVKTQNSPHWKEITFQIFDIPSENTAFEARVAFLKKLFGPGGKYECPEVVLVEHEKAKSRKHVLDKLKEVEELGGEGLMLRKAKSNYEGRRSASLLKIKTFYDAEAEVTGYTQGKGKHVGSTGALKCKMQSGKTFNVGTGLSDKQRKDPPKVGTIIVYRFQELTRDGVPRFPSFLGEAADKTKAKDAKLPAHRRTGASKDD
ncbi:DNA ligase [Mycena vitilis]|nr:DNA ligase [Mycena vitilis]